MLTGVLFELDGVLVDTRAARAESLAHAFAAEGVRLPPAAYDRDVSTPFDAVVPATAAEQVQAGVPGWTALDDTALALVALRAERDYAARVAAGVTLADGAYAAVIAFAAACRVGVVTAWQRADAERVLALAGLDVAVRFAAAADDGPTFASAAGRFSRAVARVRGSASAHPGAATGTVAALVAGATAFQAARAAGAHAVLVGQDLSLGGLTPAHLASHLASVLDGAPPSVVASSMPSPVPRR